MDDQKHSSRREVILQFVRFNIVGIINTGLTYVIYAALVFVGVNHFIALGADYSFGIAFSFIMNKRVTFRVQRRTSIGMLTRMVGSYLILLALNALLLWALVDKAGVNTYLGQALALAVVALLSFITQRLVVFGVPPQ